MGFSHNAASEGASGQFIKTDQLSIEQFLQIRE